MARGDQRRVTAASTAKLEYASTLDASCQAPKPVSKQCKEFRSISPQASKAVRILQRAVTQCLPLIGGQATPTLHIQQQPLQDMSDPSIFLSILQFLSRQLRDWMF